MRRRIAGNRILLYDAVVSSRLNTPRGSRWQDNSVNMAYHLLSSNVTYNSFASRTIGLAFILFISGACDAGGKSKTPDDLAADSALRADLALANRDTLLVDSIGQYRAAEGALADTGKARRVKAKAKPASARTGSRPAPAPVPVTAAAARCPLPANRCPSLRNRRLPPAKSCPLPVTVHRRPRQSLRFPVLADQQACLARTRGEPTSGSTAFTARSSSSRRGKWPVRAIRRPSRSSEHLNARGWRTVTPSAGSAAPGRKGRCGRTRACTVSPSFPTSAPTSSPMISAG